MKIYISKEYGSVYHLFNGELAFTPLSSYSDLYELDSDKPLKECFLHNDSGLVEWENIDEDLVKPLKEIEQKLKEQDKTEQCSNCDEQLQDDYDNQNGLCVHCYNKA